MLKDIIQLIDNKKFVEARSLLLKQLEETPSNPEINVYCAVTYDALGLEREAIPFYESALSNDISGELRESTYVQLGSSYRCIGEYHKSKDILEKGTVEYPNNLAIQAFLSIVMYNLDEKENAISSLLKILVSSSSDPWINKYSRALEFYSDKLNESW